MNELFAVAAITILAVVSPGGDFAMVTRNSYLYGRRVGVWTSIGIASAVWIHVAYTLLGVSVLLIKFPAAFHLVKTAGALYLMYIGFKTFHHRKVNVDLSGNHSEISRLVAFKTGFVTNALNPKTTLFVLSTFTQVVKTTTPMPVPVGYGAFMSLAHFVWFAAVATVLANPLIRNALLGKQIYVNRFIGVVLFGLGAMLLFAAR